MKILSSETKNLLDKLYNLRGEDSVILKQMNKEREEAIETQERTKNEKEVLLKEIERLTNEESLLAEQGNKLVDVLSNINREDFAFVLDQLKIDFDPEIINAKVSKLLPETIDKVVNHNKSAQEKLDSVEKEMNNAITKVEELGIRKDEAISDQAKLNKYINLALNGNINITRDEIVTLLEKFAFDENEQREAAKLLMFPEDALYDYDAKVNNHEIENSVSEKNEPKDSIIDEIVLVDDDADIKYDTLEEVKDAETSEEPTDLIDSQVVAEAREQDTYAGESAKATFERIIKEAGLDIAQFSEKAVTKLLENYAEDVLKQNVAIIKEKNINPDVLYENYELLYDKELNEKITKLLEIGKEPSDIGLVPSVLTKYDLNGLTNTINVLQISGLDPKKVPLMAY